MVGLCFGAIEIYGFIYEMLLR